MANVHLFASKNTYSMSLSFLYFTQVCYSPKP